MKLRFLQIVFSWLLMVCCAQYAAACSCGKSPSPCASFQKSHVVFVGLVSSTKDAEYEIESLGNKMKRRVQDFAHFVVEEPLKGITEKEVDVFSGHACGYEFKQGERYLVYAFRTENGSIVASMCSRTRPLAYAPDDLEIIRTLLKKKPQARLFGVVNEYANPVSKTGYQTDYVGPMAGLIVKVESLNEKYEAITDGDGRYLIENLKPDKYTVRLLVPPTHGMHYSFEKSTTVVNVTPDICWAAEVNFDLEVDGQISGRVYDSQGRVVGKDVKVSIVSYDSARNGIAEIKRRSAWTDKQGQYKFDGIPPGHYVIGVGIADVPSERTPYPPTYFPSASDLSQASVVTLTTGQKLTGFNLTLPPPLEKRTFTGKVLLANGKPAVGVEVELYDLERPERTMPDVTVETDASGRFSIQGFNGRRYRLKASKTKMERGVEAGLESESIEMLPEGTASPSTLILNKPVNIILYP